MRNGTKYVKSICYDEYNIQMIKKEIAESLHKNQAIQLYHSGEIGTHILESFYSKTTLDFLINSGILLKDGKSYFTDFNCTFFEGFIIFSDPDIPDALQAPLYVDPLWDRYLSKLLIRAPVNHGLDMGGGAGIISLVLSKFCKQVTYVDINKRAIALAKFNAAINSVNNINFVNSDLFEKITNIEFDYIVFNSPTDKEGSCYHRLLEAGEQILQRFFSELLYHLKPRGICQVSMGIFDTDLTAFDKIIKWLNSDYQKKLYLIAAEEEIDLKTWRRMHLTIVNTHGAEKRVRFSYNFISDSFDGNISSDFLNELLNN